MKYLGFGEILMRLNPFGYKRLRNAGCLEVSYCGAEANVMAALANFGCETGFVTKLPENDLSIAAVNCLRSHGIDTSAIKYGDGRIGVYFVEKGASYRQSKIIYDRKNSAISLSQAKEFEWDMLLEGYDLFYTTGISAAVSKTCCDTVLNALNTAKTKGLTTAFDINYRKTMWDIEDASSALTEICKSTDILIGNEEHFRLIFGIEAEKIFYCNGKLTNDGYKDLAKKVADKFGCKLVAMTLRDGNTADFNRWGAVIYADGECFFSPVYDIEIKERIGAGDAFAAGLIYALYNFNEKQKVVDFAAACACLKHSIELDFCELTIDEVLNFIEGGSASRVAR
jgi:KHG/KDPG family aldolase/carbohydrate kinase, pfkB family